VETPPASEADTIGKISSEVLRTLLTSSYGAQLTATLDDSTEAYLLVHQWSPLMAPYVFGLELVLPATAGEQPRAELQLSTQRVAVVGTIATTIDIRDLGTDLLTWTVTENVSWLDVSTPDTSTVDTARISGQGEVVLTVNTSVGDLDKAIYEGIIEVSSNGGDEIILISMSVEPEVGRDVLGFSFEGTLDGHDYYLSQESTTWRGSKFKSEELGGYLAVISTIDESEFAEAAARSVGESVWVGLTDEAEQETWVGIVDEGSVFLNWDRVSPSNANDEDFALIDRQKSYALNDVQNSGTHRFLVEFVEGSEPVERPATIIRQFTGPSGRNIEVVKVPEGEFIMGSTVSNDEKPVHTVFLDAFYIDRFEVTNIAFAEFLTARGNTEDTKGRSLIDLVDPDVEIRQGVEGFEVVSTSVSKRPAIEVSWYGAFEYCAWVGGRLPSEAEWEKAARGPRGRTYPWGERDPVSDLAIFDTTDRADVGSKTNGSSPYGALDMTGNVWEWTQDWYDAEYYARSPSNNPPGANSGSAKTARGGSWKSEISSLRPADRGRPAPESTGDVWGIRCVREVPVTDP
jgi:formylglycine-generating enzyme required for sulfatase activity